MRVLYLGIIFGFCVVSQAIFGQTTDKNGYHLFHPTPKKLMREMSTDRPDQNESAYTVDAGHIQVEMDMINATWDHNQAHGADQVTRDLVFGNTNLKIGLTNSIDLQLVGGLLTSSLVNDRMAGETSTTLGLGEFTTRLKINLWGNDSGKDAFAIMPYIKWPLPESTLRNGKAEGGIILPYSLELNETQGLGLMAQVDFVNSGGNTLQTQYFTTATLGQSLGDQFGVYVELATRFIPDADCQAQVDFGLTYRPTDEMQWDIGSNIGITPDAPDLVLFSGLTIRY